MVPVGVRIHYSLVLRLEWANMSCLIIFMFEDINKFETVVV